MKKTIKFHCFQIYIIFLFDILNLFFCFVCSGNPAQITVMGQQAGGASVHYHLLSPLARGLFNRYLATNMWC